MGISPSHKFGQIIGEVLETAVLPLLQKFADENKLFLDTQSSRPCRDGKKCTWTDAKGNAHDLDFVLERGGTPDKIGSPVAFIETAWRRYTKHSRNKAQEIQGAIIPLAERYHHVFPFKGAILAGVFTEGALTQMRSLGFTILYFPYEMVVKVFKRFGISAAFDEKTPDEDFQKKVDAYAALSATNKAKLARALLAENDAAVKRFVADLTQAASRTVERVIILPLHGQVKELATVEDAIKFITAYDEQRPPSGIERYEVQVRYSNGDVIEGKFKEKRTAVEFLRAYQVKP